MGSGTAAVREMTVSAVTFSGCPVALDACHPVLVRGGEWSIGLLLDSDEIEAGDDHVSDRRLGPKRSLDAANGERLVLGADRLCLWLRAVGG